MRKTLISIILAVLLLSALCACGGKASPASPPQSVPAAFAQDVLPAAEQPPRRRPSLTL